MAEGRPIVGAQVRLPFTVTDATGTLVDATTQTVTVTLPDGTPSTPAVVHDSVGTYHADYVITLPGHHDWYATTTGPVTRSTVNAFNAGSQTIGPISGLTEIRNEFNAFSTTNDAELLTVAMRASAAVEQYCGCSWRRVTVTEAYDGGKSDVVLRSAPVSSVVSVTESGILLTGSDYVVDPSANILTRGTATAPRTWKYGVQNVAVVYVVAPIGGIIPDDVIQGNLQMVRHLMETQRGASNRPRQAGADSGAAPGAAFTYPTRVKELLDPYVYSGMA